MKTILHLRVGQYLELIWLHQTIASPLNVLHDKLHLPTHSWQN